MNDTRSAWPSDPPSGTLASDMPTRSLDPTAPAAPASRPTVASLEAGALAVGRMTSGGWSPTLGRTLGLAMIKRGYFEPGQALTVDGAAAAEVIATPAVASTR